MRAKTVAKRPVGELPLGMPVETDPEPNKSSGMPKTTEKVWYVLVVEVDRPTQFSIGRFTNRWHFAYTKSFAREIARREQARGHTVIDIFPGTKVRTNHKFQGL